MVLLQFRCLQKYLNKYPEKSNTEDEYVFQIITGKYLQRLVPNHALIFLLLLYFFDPKVAIFLIRLENINLNNEIWVASSLHKPYGEIRHM